MRRRQFLSAAGTGVAAGAFATMTPSALALGSPAGRMMPTRMADGLVRNYLINTKLFYATEVYKHTDAVIDLLTELGVRGVRERVTTGTSLGTRAQLYAMPRLAQRGIRWHGTVGNLEDWADATAVNREVMTFLATRYAPLVDNDLTQLMHSFGGCNEIDGPGRDGKRDPDWVPHARMMQRALWEQAKQNPLTAGVPVAGPSTRTDFNHTRAAQLGDLSGWSELGNGHLYNKGQSPTEEIDGHLQILQPCFPGIDRYVMTETGYNNSPQTNTGRTVPEFASAIYAVRGICDFFKRNTAYGRFELLDDPDPINFTSQQTINQTANREAHFGLVAMTKTTVAEATPDTWRKKPEFYATKRLLGLLADPGPDFAPAAEEITVTGGGPDLQTLLLQKRNGRHYLALWRDVDVVTPFPEANPIHVGRQVVTVQMDRRRPVAVYAPSRQDGPLRTESPRRDFNVSVRGDLKVVEIG